MRKPKNPTHADRRCSIGLANKASIFGAILWRREIKVKDRKKRIEKEMAIAMNTGVEAVGGESRSDAFSGRTESSVTSRG